MGVNGGDSPEAVFGECYVYVVSPHAELNADIQFINEIRIDTATSKKLNHKL